MKIYVSGPMTGLPEFNYPAFREAGEQLWRDGYDVLNPIDAEKHNPTPGQPQEWRWYMRHAIRMLAAADGVALLPGWKKSRGARLEVHIAHTLGLPVQPLESWTGLAAVER